MSRPKRAPPACLGMMVLACVACGGGVTQSLGLSGIEADKPLMALTSGDRERMCEWMYSPGGPFGTHEEFRRCTPAGSQRNRSHSECLEGLGDAAKNKCPASVAAVEVCLLKLMWGPCTYDDPKARPEECQLPRGC